MQLARVVGRATATMKHRSLAGQKLLLIQLLDGAGGPDGEPQLAIDSLGAGRGDLVLATTDGKEVARITNDETCPVRWSILGLAD